MTQKTTHISPTPRALIHHLHRLQGQLNAVESELEKDSPSCQKMSTTLSAASRSFASLRAAFVDCFLDQYTSLPTTRAERDAYDALLRIIKS